MPHLKQRSSYKSKTRTTHLQITLARGKDGNNRALETKKGVGKAVSNEAKLFLLNFGGTVGLWISNQKEM